MLTIFIDALSYAVAQKVYQMDSSLFLGSAPRMLRAGAGYSSNLHWQIFASETPDQLGFFGDWGVDCDRIFSPSPRFAMSLLSITDQNILFNSFSRILRRKLGFRDHNIPWIQKHCFVPTGTYLFSDKNAPASVVRERIGVIESGNWKRSLSESQNRIEDGEEEITVVINELDSLGHSVGGTSDKVIDLSSEILMRAKEVADHYRSAFPKQRIRYLSDHGMHDVTHSIDILGGLIDCFGALNKNIIVYTDSVYVRIWVKSDDTYNKVEDFLKLVPSLKILGERERKALGISNTNFGHIIGVLQDGAVFSPNMFSLWVRGGPKGMHGYIGENSWSNGFYVDNFNQETSLLSISDL